MRPVRLFTPAEADAALPAVRPLVRDVRAAHGRWQESLEEYELIASSLQAGDEEPLRLLEARDSIRSEALLVDDLLERLRELGAELKSFELGTVDFLSLRQDSPVLLCWRDGEATVGHWHPLDAGFAGRQPLDAAIFQKADA